MDANNKCNFCQKQQLIYNCQEFLNLEPKIRRDNIKKLNLCENCLRTGRNKETCVRGPCRKCFNRHNTLLHVDISRINLGTNDESINEQSTVLFSEINFLNNAKAKEILLSTAVISVKNANGENIPCTVLLDNSCNYSTNITCFLDPIISGYLPIQKFSASSWNIPKNISFANLTV